jgi:hypothetical protein
MVEKDYRRTTKLDFHQTVDDPCLYVRPSKNGKPPALFYYMPMMAALLELKKLLKR